MDAVVTGNRSDCLLRSSLRTARYAFFACSLFFLVLAPRVLHLAVARFRQPPLVSEFILGLLFGNWVPFRLLVDNRVPYALGVIAEVTVTFYMFVTGLEMDPRAMRRKPTREVVIAYAGIASAVAVFVALYPLFDRGKLSVAVMHSWRVACIMGIIFASSSSPVLTRLTTELKIGKSDIGRLAVKAGIHNDMVTTLFLCLTSAYARNHWIMSNGDTGKVGTQMDGRYFEVFFTLAGISLEVLFICKVMPRFMAWIDERNPEGKRMKGFDLTLSLLLINAICFVSGLFLFSYRTNAFLVGLFLPREGRVANHLVSKMNFFLSTIGIPLYLCHIGLRIDLGAWTGVTMNSLGQSIQWGWGISLCKLAVFVGVTTIGKVIGTSIASTCYGFRLPEAIALGLLLNVKGMFHIFLIYGAMESEFINANTGLVVLLVVMSSIMCIPMVVATIVWRSRRTAHRRLMGLQWHDPASELRMVVGIHGPQNVPALINVIEATRGQGRKPLLVYAMDLVELTDRAAATLVHGQGGLDAVTVMDEGIMETRNAITHALDAYVQESGEGLIIRRLLTVSSYSNMHEDICNGAEDIMAVLIILPYHRSQRIDGAMDSEHHGHRQVNAKVLQSTPCSVGILVDRGLAGQNPNSVSHGPKQVAVVFVGGSDDREALVYAGRMAQHPGVHMTAIRFLYKGGAGEASHPSSTRGHVLALINKREKEMQLDDACFTEFYERHIDGGTVGYVEKYVGDGAETVATLRTLEGLYNLFLVGAARTRDSMLTTGMGDWAECPELGPIGDVLASSDFSVTASVLVIQQHSADKKLDAIDAEFSVL